MDAGRQVGHRVAVVGAAVEQEVLLGQIGASTACQAWLEANSSAMRARASASVSTMLVTSTWSGWAATMASMSRGVVSESGLSGVDPEAMFVRRRVRAICPAIESSSFTASDAAVT